MTTQVANLVVVGGGSIDPADSADRRARNIGPKPMPVPQITERCPFEQVFRTSHGQMHPFKVVDMVMRWTH